MNAIQTDENSFLNSLTVFEKVGPTISNCFSSMRACAWGDIAPLRLNINPITEKFFLEMTIKENYQHLEAVIAKQYRLIHVVTLYLFRCIQRG